MTFSSISSSSWRGCASEARAREVKPKLVRREASDRPKIVCLCGSLRFQHLFESERQRLTAQGVIVLGPETISEELTRERRAALGELHLRRIDLADEIRVVSEGGYLGSATHREIEYARKQGKAISSVEQSLGL